jgi:hypothetical protein
MSGMRNASGRQDGGSPRACTSLASAMRVSRLHEMSGGITRIVTLRPRSPATSVLCDEGSGAHGTFNGDVFPRVTPQGDLRVGRCLLVARHSEHSLGIGACNGEKRASGAAGLLAALLPTLQRANRHAHEDCEL